MGFLNFRYIYKVVKKKKINFVLRPSVRPSVGTEQLYFCGKMHEKFTGWPAEGRVRGVSIYRIEICLKLGEKSKKKRLLNVDLSTFMATFAY